VQPLAVRGAVLELVVGGAGHDVHVEAVEGVVVHHGTQRAGREHVGGHVVDALRRHRPGAERIHDAPDPLGVDVRDREAGALGHEVLAEVVAHVP
jgi:hypothetical protein